MRLLADNYRIPVHLSEAYICVVFSHLVIRMAATKVLYMKQHCVLVEQWLGKTRHEWLELYVKRIRL